MKKAVSQDNVTTAVEHLKTLAPRMPAPGPTIVQTTGAGRLPEDILLDQIKRLRLVSLVGAGLWTYGLIMDTVFFPYRDVPIPTAQAKGLEVAGIVVSLLFFAFLRFDKKPAEAKVNAGLAYMLLNAAFLGAFNTWATIPTAHTMGHLSWNTILILVYSMIAPASPRRMLWSCLAAASMDPLGIWFAHLRGVPVPNLPITFVLYAPNYVCAVIATLPSHVLHGMGRRLREAEHMGSYQLIELLGHGGMGEVWRARHRLLARSAAIKLVRPELLGAHNDAEAGAILRRFEREAQATASLSSPHTIDLFDYGMTEEGTFYYVMELLVGRDLESMVREFGPLPADRVMFLLRQICHSLADAHARNLVHRDIKPANIYVCRMGLEYDFIKVLDFGLVKSSDRSLKTPSLMTVEHTTTGTPAYMAPEIILGDVEVDRRADVYALGCVAYFLLTGHLVFDADSTMKMLLQHVNAAPIPPSQRTELSIPREIDDLVLACLEKDPKKRPQNAEELLRMARQCRSADCWGYEQARVWWQNHLPELTRPLGTGEPPVEPAARAVAVH